MLPKPSLKHLEKEPRQCWKQSFLWVMLVSTVMIFLFSSCAPATNQLETENELRAIYQTNGISEEDEKASKLYNEMNTTINRYFEEKTEMEIVSMKEDEITVNVKAPDLSKLVDRLRQEDFSQMTYAEAVEYCKQQVIRALQEEDYTVTENTVTMKYSVKDGKMQIQYNEDYLRAAYPGLYGFYEEVAGGSME